MWPRRRTELMSSQCKIDQGVERELVCVAPVLESLLCVFCGPHEQELNPALLLKSVHATHLNHHWRRRILHQRSAHLLRGCIHRSTPVSLHRVRMPWAVRQCRVTPSPWSSFRLEPPCPGSPLPGETCFPQWTHNPISSVNSLIVAWNLNQFYFSAVNEQLQLLPGFSWCVDKFSTIYIHFKLSTLLILSLASWTETLFSPVLSLIMSVLTVLFMTPPENVSLQQKDFLTLTLLKTSIFFNFFF